MGAAGNGRSAISGVSASSAMSSSSGDWEVLTAELQRYEYALGPTGQVFYSAPSGFHDDCVMALALAQRGRLRFGMRPGAMARIPLVNDGGGRAVDGREVGSGYVIGGRRNPRLGGRRVRFLG